MAPGAGAAGAKRAPNLILRGIREQDRRETRAEFAEAMARVARDMGESAFPDGKYVARLETGDVVWPRPLYRRILEQLCGRPVSELGFERPPLPLGGDDHFPGNAVLREAVYTSGLEIPDLARRIGVDRKTVDRWISTGRVPHPKQRWMACEILGYDENELWPQLAEVNSPGESGEDNDVINGAVISRALSDLPEFGIEESSASALVSTSTSEAVKLITSAGQGSIDPLVIEQYFDDIRRLSVVYISSTAGVDRQVLREATALRGSLQQLLDAYRNSAQSSDIHLMIGMLSGICSYACLDLGFPDEAMTQARASFIMGDLAGHDGLRAWAMGTRSLIARFQGQYSDALKYARQGMPYATTGTSLVRLRCGEGQTLAHMGDTENAIHALNLAKEARERASSPDITGGLFTFTEAKQIYYSGSSMQWLPGEKNAKTAEQESAQAIRMFQQDSPETRALGDELLAHCYLGNSRITLGEIDGSLEALRPVLNLPPHERNAWHRKRMRQIAKRLESGKLSDSRLAISARDEIASFIETREQG